MSGQGEQLDPVRCPYCVLGYEFRLMTDLTGGAGRIFYCPACRHLVRAAQPDFQCCCRSCMNLRRPAPLETSHAASTGEEQRSAEFRKNQRRYLARSTSG